MKSKVNRNGFFIVGDLALRSILLLTLVLSIPSHGVLGFTQDVSFQSARTFLFDASSLLLRDFDGDGKLDMAVVRSSGEVEILAGDGTGSFVSSTILLSDLFPSGMTAGDFNGDGQLDIVVVGAPRNDSRDIVVMLSDGVLSYSQIALFPEEGGSARGVAAADLNGDGKLDLAVAMTNNLGIAVLLGDGIGGFSDRSYFPSGDGPGSVAIKDFNQDGILDLAVANQDSHNLSILLGDGSGSFAAPLQIALAGEALSVAVGDFNADGRSDLAVATAGNTPGGFVSILFGDGAGSFSPGPNITMGSRPSSVAIADFNADGKQDLAITKSGSLSLSIVLGDNTGAFGPVTDFAAGFNARSIEIADVNSDGKPDIAVTTTASSLTDGGSLSVLLGKGNGDFSASRSIPAGFEPVSVALGDLNNDGKLDLIVVNRNLTDDKVLIRLGDGFGSFGPSVGFPVGVREARSVAIADLNGDGKPDLAIASIIGVNSAGGVSILLGDGAGSFGPGSVFPAGMDSKALAIGDFNGDAKPDLVVVNRSSDNVSILLGDGAGSFSSPSSFAVGSFPNSVAIGDLNADGNLDVAVTNGGGDSGYVSILLGSGTGSFVSAPNAAVGNQSSCVALADLNKDGKLDLIATRPLFSFSGVVIIELGTGSGTFEHRSSVFSLMGTSSPGEFPNSVAVGDLNGDGNLDVAVLNDLSGDVSIALGDGTGSFPVDGIKFSAGGNPSSISIGDLNGDGQPDLAISNKRSNDVSILINATILPNTPAGNNVTVQPADSTTGTTPATLTFSHITQAGTTSLTTSSSGPPPPSGFKLGNPATYYELTTSAAFSGSIGVCINYAGVSFADESSLRMFHLEGGSWVDVTTSLNTGADVICGSVSSLSPFAVFERVSQQTRFFYLHGTGPNSNPPTLFLNNTSAPSTTAKSRDSAAVNFSGGNPWKEVGMWTAAPALATGTLRTLSDVHVWLGLKNSDDQGTRFDLRVEAYKNGTLVAEGEAHCIDGVTRNPSQAKEVTVMLAPFSPAVFNGSTEALLLKILTRIGTNGAGLCGGHSNATGLRLYFDADTRSARFTAIY